MTKNNKLNMQKYFSYANTCDGTVNYSDIIFSPYNFDKIYIVKGVFSQTFISKISEKYSCECFLNPINPAKTDGIIINKVAVVDGSLVNFDDSQYPAVIINLGEFLDESFLNQKREQIYKFIKQKHEAYNSARKLLKAANETAEYLFDLSAKYLNEKKLISAAERILSKRSGITDNIKNDYRFINSIASGELDTLEKEANKIYYISNENFTGFHFMRYIAEKANGSKIICPDALDTKRVRSVYFKNEKILFALQSKSEKIYDEKYNYINMERFIASEFKKEHKQKLKFIKKIYDSLIGEAADYFTSVKNINAELEKIYAQSLDNQAQQKFTADFIKKL